ncbi:hypothetical protein [Gordonia sp. YC-JH1]|uniref:hypothetical protein n=1 Tax=Gordonia sp. YC-JH1 TaxID=2059875 RepID=UPI0018F4FF8E|nr:hypothetical protein [Gordonia sp. YC-JH1]
MSPHSRLIRTHRGAGVASRFRSNDGRRRLLGTRVRQRLTVRGRSSALAASEPPLDNTFKPSTEPPYSVGQDSANDLNANVSYPTLDGRIKATYAERSIGRSKNSLYDSYLRAFRWATDRIGDTGIVAFVSNGGWINGNTAAGVRLSLADEYSRIYVYNLRGNQRTAGELSHREGGKVFGSGSRSTIAIWIGVKNPSHAGSFELLYRDIGDYLSRDEKLAIINDGHLDTIDWTPITPTPTATGTTSAMKSSPPGLRSATNDPNQARPLCSAHSHRD